MATCTVGSPRYRRPSLSSSRPRRRRTRRRRRADRRCGAPPNRRPGPAVHPLDQPGSTASVRPHTAGRRIARQPSTRTRVAPCRFHRRSPGGVDPHRAHVRRPGTAATAPGPGLPTARERPCRRSSRTGRRRDSMPGAGHRAPGTACRPSAVYRCVLPAPRTKTQSQQPN